eukprot:7427632-Pyramimonas_sp.AAC.1
MAQEQGAQPSGGTLGPVGYAVQAPTQAAVAAPHQMPDIAAILAHMESRMERMGGESRAVHEGGQGRSRGGNQHPEGGRKGAEGGARAVAGGRLARRRLEQRLGLARRPRP